MKGWKAMARTSVKFLFVVAALGLVIFLVISVRRTTVAQKQVERDGGLNTRLKIESDSPVYEDDQRDDGIKFAKPFVEVESSRLRKQQHTAESHPTPANYKQTSDWNENNVTRKDPVSGKDKTDQVEERNKKEERVNLKEKEAVRLNKGRVEDGERDKTEDGKDLHKEEKVNINEEENKAGGNVKENRRVDLRNRKDYRVLMNGEKGKGGWLEEDPNLNQRSMTMNAYSGGNDKKDQDKELLVNILNAKDSGKLHNTNLQKGDEDADMIDGNGLGVQFSSSAVKTTTEPDLTTPSPPMPTFYPSKDLFVRAVYFDGRPRDGHHNTSVFLVVCMQNITDSNLIVGCQIDGNRASQFSVKLIGETPLWRAFYPKINHEEVLVHCYDLPAKNGSNGYIMYRMTKHSDVVVAASERPLVIPPPRIKPTSPEGVKYNMTIVTCAKIFNQPPWLREWLTYQRTLGVDHVHLDVEDSFVSSGGLQQPYVKKMMGDGFLSIDIWKKYLGMWELWYHNQGLIYEDCPYRFLGTYDFIVMLDTDDFFTPREPNEMKMHYYINKYCRRNHVGSCKFKWVEYFPDVYGFNDKSTKDGNITRALRNYSHYFQGNPKSLHRTTALIDTATHYAYIMMPEYKIFDVPLSVAYVAHVRKFKKLPNFGLVEGVPNSCMEHCISRLFIFMVVCLVFIIFD